MDFLIADTFIASLAKLTGEEQKIVKTTAFDLQINPVNPGMQLHKLDRARDKNFWSARVGRDIRVIIHKTQASMLLCYVDHHDKAYEWAERRRLETHPKTGAAQLVEIRETVQQVVIPPYDKAQPETLAPKPLFANVPDDELLSYGVPAEWLQDVRQADEESFFVLAERLPSEAVEALLQLASGGKPTVPRLADAALGPFAHPDAQRRFRLIADAEELQRALEFPWDKWAVFLHPEQRQLVEKEHDGPARISGSAGTGKTVVALHRAVFLARTNPSARILLTTFSPALADSLRVNLRRLISDERRLAERLEVQSLNAIGERLYKALVGPAKLASDDLIRDFLKVAAQQVGNHRFSLSMLHTEWEQVVDAWQLETWESYRDVLRLGRKTRRPETQRAVLWSIFERVRAELSSRNLLTISAMFTRLAASVAASKNPPFDLVVVDEAQDLGIAHMRFLASLAHHRQDALFFTGDFGQRIFQQPFSWLALGIDVRGRSQVLHVNYRTSQQIRMQADKLLGAEVSDADGHAEARGNTISLFSGPAPDIQVFDRQEEEISRIGEWISERAKAGIAPHEFSIIVRSVAELDRARAAVAQAGFPFRVLDENFQAASDQVAICTMHLAKGLEFRASVVMACDDEIIPLQGRIQTVGDDADLQEVYDTERHLLYVACTRAREHLLVTGVAPASEFLDDLRRAGAMN